MELPGIPLDVGGIDPAYWFSQHVLEPQQVPRFPPPSERHVLVVCFDPAVVFQQPLRVIVDASTLTMKMVDGVTRPNRLYGWITRSYVERACSGLIDLPLRY